MIFQSSKTEFLNCWTKYKNEWNANLPTAIIWIWKEPDGDRAYELKNN